MTRSPTVLDKAARASYERFLETRADHAAHKVPWRELSEEQRACWRHTASAAIVSFETQRAIAPVAAQLVQTSPLPRDKADADPVERSPGALGIV